MYKLWVQYGFATPKLINDKVKDLGHCELEMAFYCRGHELLTDNKITWNDDKGRMVYDLGIPGVLFLCTEYSEYKESG